MKLEKEYLTYILQVLEGKIKSLTATIGDVEKDLEDMNEYFWENFSEFDEYGYEEYDNQTAYLMRSREREDHFQELKRYKKMQNSPYFGKIQFVYEGEEEPESFYIGIGNLWKEDEMVPLIFDWRAPVSGLFYDYDKGPACYEAPSGVLHGEITEKMQFKIKHGRMVYGFACDVKIDDEILRSELAKSADAKLKSIVTTIQKEQNAIIRNKEDKILVIQGCAGSGKTSIALHRIAYLLYHNRKTLQASSVLILSPNSIFADYISHILPELGEENISEMSFDDFAYRELKDIAESEDVYDYLEQLLNLSMQSADEAEHFRVAVQHKQSKEFMVEMHEFALHQEYELLDFKDFRYKGIEKSADYMAEMFYEKFPDVPIMKRLENIAEYIIDEAETLRGKDYQPEEKEEILEKIRRMYETTSLEALYVRFLKEYGYDSDILQGGKLRYEDVYPLLYMKYLMWGVKHMKPVKHLVIDEMQDYSYLQYAIIGKLFSCPMTILGDRAQSLSEHSHDVRTFLREILGRDMKVIEITKSYRSTCEIMEFAATVGGEQNVIPFDRHGRKPEIVTCKDAEEKYDRLADAIRDDGEAETVAVLVLNEAAAAEVSAQLKKRLGGDKVALLDKNTMKFKAGIVVTTYYLAKGLEFDAVYVADGENPVYQTELGRQAMYICATRALHSLDIYQS